MILGDALEPVRAGLGRALLGFKVNVEEAVALVIAVGPAELVLQAPHKVAANVDTAFDGLEDPAQVVFDVCDAPFSVINSCL